MSFLVDFNFYLWYNTVMINARHSYSMYHKDIFIPKEFVSFAMENQRLLPTGRYSWHLENHFSFGDEKHAITKRGFARVLKKIISSPVAPFEVTSTNGWVRKNMWLDGTPFIKTAWLNNKDDYHTTLDRRKYMPNLMQNS